MSNITINTSDIETDEDFILVAKMMMKKQWKIIMIHDLSWEERNSLRHLSAAAKHLEVKDEV